MTTDRSDEAIEVLSKTRDGEDLAPRDLYLVQLAVNGDLNEAGKVAWDALVANVRNGYVKPWLYGIEHLTKDHSGRVFWRGVEIEHYSFRDSAVERVAAEELASACRLVEHFGHKVTGYGPVSAAMDRMRVAIVSARHGDPRTKNEIMRDFAPNADNGLADMIWAVLVRNGEHRLAGQLTTATNAMRASQIEEEPIVVSLRRSAAYLNETPSLYAGSDDDAEVLRKIADRIEATVKP